AKYGVGRRHDNDLRIKETYISGYHAELNRNDDGDYELSDLGSSNGTFLNGKKVEGREIVKAGDFVKFGILKVAVEERTGRSPKVVSLKDRAAFSRKVEGVTSTITPESSTGLVGTLDTPSPSPISGKSKGEPSPDDSVIAELKSQLKKTEERADLLDKEVAKRNKEVESLSSEIAEAKTEAEKAQAKLSDSQKDCKKSSELEAKLAALSAEGQENKAKSSDLAKQLVTATAALAAAEKLSSKFHSFLPISDANPMYIGIDLGTSTSALAHVRSDGNPEIVPNADGELLTPSVVFFDQFEGVKLIGSSAKDGGDPERTVRHIKKHMDDPSFVVEIDGEKWTPTEISALILSKLKRECSKLVGEIQDVVITVPANFNELARKATVTAGKLAGLNVKRIVNEPTAAALFYAHTKDIKGRILVYDLGGGTLDITILDIEDDNIDILLSEGAYHLGESNFDDVPIDLIGQKYREQNGKDLILSDVQRRRLLSTSEDTKKRLSKLNMVSEKIGGEDFGLAEVELTRDSFEEAIRRLLTRTVMLVEQALDNLDLKPSDIDHVVLVGGSTRIPEVQTLLEKQFGKPPISCGNVDESVALGAALFAQRARRVSEVCNHSYGALAIIEDATTGIARLQNSVVIPKNTPIPCSMSQTYMTSEDNEELIEVEITQGEDLDPRYIDVLGKISLRVPPGRPAGCEITVTYSYDENQRVRAQIYDEASGLREDIAIKYKGEGVLGDEAVERKSAYLKQVKTA
ncbi:Hsp70 family protein, partial [Verrucomicrobiales bacterium]|nr:Hsp70 family protein [Verrucomicrobiales bacterium]